MHKLYFFVHIFEFKCSFEPMHRTCLICLSPMTQIFSYLEKLQVDMLISYDSRTEKLQVLEITP